MTDQLKRIGAAEEVQVVTIRPDGTPRKPVTMWVVRQGDDLYVRSVRGRSGQWFRGAQERHEGRLRAVFSETSHSPMATTVSMMK